MSLKQSCFKSIVKSDLKRFWWVGVLSALFIFMNTTSPLFSQLRHYDFYGYVTYDSALQFCNRMSGNYVVGAIVAAFCAVVLFSYVNKVNSVSFFHSLPAKRSTLLSSHITSSAIIITFPMLINTLVSFFAVGKGIRPSWVLLSLAMYLIYSFLVFFLTLVVTMLTGVSMAGSIFTVVVMLLPLFLFAYVNELCTNYLYGFSDYGYLEDVMLEYIYLSPEMLASWHVLVYIAFIAIFAFLSYFIYNKRHLENYGEVIAFTNLKGLFKVLFGFCAGILSYWYFDGFWGIQSILTMFVFGILGVIIAHMLANKSFSLRGVWKSLLVTCGLIIILFIAFFFDLFGFEKRIPDKDDIAYVEIDGLYYDDYTYVPSDINGEGSVRVREKDIFVPYFRSDEEISLFLDLHKYAVDKQSENDDYEDSFIAAPYRIAKRNNFTFKYTLKNGNTVERRYSLPVKELEEFTSKIYTTDTYKKWKYPVLDGTEKDYVSIAVYNRRLVSVPPVYVDYSSDKFEEIIEAIKKDRDNMSYDMMKANDYGQIMSLELSYNKVYVSDDGREFEKQHTDTYNISMYDTNTWEIIKSLNLFEGYDELKPENIKLSEVYLEEVLDSTYGVDYNENARYTVSAAQFDDYYYDEYTLKTRDSQYMRFEKVEDIAVLYDIYMNQHNEMSGEGKYYVFNISFDLADNKTVNRTVLIHEQNVPKLISDFTIYR